MTLRQLLLALGLGGIPSALTAQVSPTAVTGFITGRVIDDSARALPGAEAVIAALKLRVVTGADGQFRLERVPAGSWSLLVRAIGFLPNSQIVAVGRRGTNLGVVQLHRAVTILPQLEVTGKLPVPAFALGFATSLEDVTNCAWCGKPINYHPAGASLTEDGLYLALSQPFGRRDPPSVSFRTRPIGLGEWARHGSGKTAGVIQCNRRNRPIATRIDGATARVLYSTGAVWLERLDPWSDECFQAIRLTLGGSALAAAPLDQGWLIAVEDSAGLTSLRRFNDFGRQFWSVPLEAVLGSAAPVKQVMLAPANGGVTVALSGTPFVWALVDSAGAVILRSSPFTGPGLDDLLAQTDLNGWRSYAVLAVRNGLLQTLESPDHRQGIFVLYDILGRPAKVTRRAGASVLIASAPELRMLLGYQYNNAFGGLARLYVYRY